MDDIYVVQSDAQTRQFDLSTDLTGRSVETILTRKQDGRQIDLDNEPTIVNASDGIIEHHFTQEDLGTWGEYYLEFRITGGPEDPTTIPQDSPIDFTIRWSSRLVEEINQLRGIDSDRINFEGRTINPQKIETEELVITGSGDNPNRAINRAEMEEFGEELLSEYETDHEGDDISPERVMSFATMSRNEVPEGEKLVIPEGYGLVAVGPYEVKGELVVDGRIKIV